MSNESTPQPARCGSGSACSLQTEAASPPTLRVAAGYWIRTQAGRIRIEGEAIDEAAEVGGAAAVDELLAEGALTLS